MLGVGGVVVGESRKSAPTQLLGTHRGHVDEQETAFNWRRLRPRCRSPGGRVGRITQNVFCISHERPQTNTEKRPRAPGSGHCPNLEPVRTSNVELRTSNRSYAA